ncbi:hypothetical protein ACJX0J_025531 [Zea mays]
MNVPQNIGLTSSSLILTLLLRFVCISFYEDLIFFEYDDNKLIALKQQGHGGICVVMNAQQMHIEDVIFISHILHQEITNEGFL